MPMLHFLFASWLIEWAISENYTIKINGLILKLKELIFLLILAKGLLFEKWCTD